MASTTQPAAPDTPRPRRVRLHGNEVNYLSAGTDGPLVVLVHGITGSVRTWDSVIPPLAKDHRVIAPDLLGHGESAKPRGDYSLGAHASGVRDLLDVLGHDTATIVGHSLGGGIAMQFAYQFPEKCERLVLVASGGLGREVALLLRAATLPGSQLVLPVLGSSPMTSVLGWLERMSAKLPGGPDASLHELGRGLASFRDPATRRAFLHTLRAVVDVKGQTVDASDRLYLAAEMPTLIVWGDRDGIIPVSHATAAHAAMPGSKLEIFRRAGHFPHCDAPERFAEVLARFVAESPAARIDRDRLRERLARGA